MKLKFRSVVPPAIVAGVSTIVATYARAQPTTPSCEPAWLCNLIVETPGGPTVSIVVIVLVAFVAGFAAGVRYARSK